MTPNSRRGAILRAASEGARLDVESLARELGASRETIRRDLAALDREGLVRRVHGGAVAVAAGAGPFESAFAERMGQAVAAKRAIARHVAAGLKPGDSILVDTGSSTLYLARELQSCKGLIVITNSADIAAHAARGEGSRVILIGGEFRPEGREMVGDAALAQIAALRAGEAIVTVAGLGAEGALDIDPREAEVARAMIAQARKVTVIADQSKMNRPGVFAVCPLASIHRIVTDGMPDDLREAARRAGVIVEIVKPE